MSIFKHKTKKTNDKEEKSSHKKRRFKFFYIFRIIFAIFTIILIYISMNFVRIFNKKGITYYEVNSGEIVNVDRHTGVIFREEYVEKANSDGYINFFVANTERVNRGAFIYSISDEENNFEKFSLNNDDKLLIKQKIKIAANNITDHNFSNVYAAKNNIDNQVNEINIVKQLENVDFEKELTAKEKGYARHAGLISFIIDGHENDTIESFDTNTINDFNNIKVSTKIKEVAPGDNIYKIVTNPEFSIAFDSDYNYDDMKNKNVNIKFLYENISASGKISSFLGDDEKKHYKVTIDEYPESFIDKRVVDFEIENKKISGLKIPIKSIVSKNCFVIPRDMIERDIETDEDIFYKLGIDGKRERISCNISKEDDEYYYVSIDDSLSNLKYGDTLINRYNDTYSLSDVRILDGVYNLNKGYAIFKNVDIIDRTNEYAIIRNRTSSGVALYDHIALNAADIKEGDLIA